MTMLNIRNYSLLWLLFFLCPIYSNAQIAELTHKGFNGDFSTKFNDESTNNPAIQLAPHPRLFFSKDEEKSVLQKAKNNTLLSQLIEVLHKEADKDLNAALQTYLPDDHFLSTSREQIRRVLNLSMAYRLFKDDRYAKKAEEELLNISSFPSWNPDHFLDVAEMTTAAAIGYDWCYDYLSPASRQIVEKSIIDNAFAPAWPIYETEGKTPFNRENNWNMVCNSGMVNGALAIGDKYPQEMEKIVQYAIKYTPHLLESFASEGVFNEGPGYWSYNGMYMALFFDNLNRIIKNDYGLPDFEGLNNTARFYIAQVGASNQSFNYGDASEKIDYSPTFFFLSKQYKQPDVAAFYRSSIKSALGEYQLKGDFSLPRLFFLSIPWFDDSAAKEVIDDRLTIFKGVTDLIIINGDKKSVSNRLYLAAKTGRGSWSHNHLDGGSFVLDCDGERWAIEIGAESYSLPDFWDYKPGGVRWNYFRNTNQAHSTLTIDNKISNSDGMGEIVKSNKDVNQPFGIFDLSSYYPDKATSVIRGFKLLAPKTVLVKDEIVLKPGAKEVSWRFITNAEVKVNRNTATLSQNGKLFYIKCLLPDVFQLKVFPAKPYSKEEKPIKGVNIVEITLNASGKLLSIPVLLSNKMDESERTSEINLQLKDWK